MSRQVETAGTFTGRHMLFIMLAFFATILVANLSMATFANTSWTGLVVKNSYVASQEYNGRLADSRAQMALGYTSDLSVGNGEIRYRLTTPDGKAVRLGTVNASFRHPAYEAGDRNLALLPDGKGGVSAAQILSDGMWIVEIDSDIGQDRPYRDVRRVVVSGGAIR